MSRILLVEDELKIARALRSGLEAEAFDVDVAVSGADGLRLLLTEMFDVAVLDVMLPDVDGIAILTQARSRDVRTPVLILTARDTVEDRVLGLESGADDYLVKPFAFPELLARLRALLRRGRPDQVVPLTLGDMKIDVIARSVTRSGQPLTLTSREFDLLEYLVRHQNEVVSREMIAREVWKESRATPIDNVIDVHIARLRKKLDADGADRLIHTIRGVGFVARENGP